MPVALDASTIMSEGASIVGGVVSLMVTI